MTEGHILRDGARLCWTASGEGRAVLFQHGLGGDNAQAAGLFPAAFRRLTLECRGHGASDAKGPFDFGTFATDLEALPEVPAIVGGVSMGAALAMMLAHRRGARGLILVRPAWEAGPAKANLAPNAEVAAGTFDPARLAGYPDNLASLRGLAARPDFAPVLAAMSADDPGLGEDDIRAIACPALILSAPRDFIHPIALAEELAALLPDATHITLPDKADHPDEHRAEAARAIAAFLEQIDA